MYAAGSMSYFFFFFFQAEDGIRDLTVTGVQTCALPISPMKFDFLKDMRKGDKLTLSVYSMGAHSGTHIDAPMHFVAGGAPVDQGTLQPLVGPARVIHIPDSVQGVEAAQLNRHDREGATRGLF